MAGGCSILDIVAGGGLLPHVYCKKVTLENGPDTESINVTLNLEMMQSKNDLSKSTWLNSLKLGDQSILDYMFIQIVPFENISNILKLDPTHNPTKADIPGNAYTVSGHPEYRNLLGNNMSFFPIGTLGNEVGIDPPSLSEDTYGTRRFSGLMFTKETTLWGANGDAASQLPSPIQISNSSLLGNIVGADLLDSPGQQIFAREEIIHGKPYYIIPFEYKYNLKTPVASLGFLFYPFLNIPLFLGVSGDAATSLAENVLTGPVSTEIIFKEGKLQNSRKQFYLPTGRAWHGAVHLHIDGLNPAPDGYSGDGGLGTGAGSGFRGWMTGDKHINDAPKLKLAQVPNYKIQDFRFTPKQPLDTMLGLSANDKIQIFNQKTYESATGDITGADVVSGIESIIGFFQKETRKYLAKFDGKTFTNLYDNDSEFSKLYVSRDKQNSARGLFMINFEYLLKNNSLLYGLLDGNNPNEIAKNCLSFSKLIELKVYRDRVKKKPIGKTYEKYANDTFYEEPSYLVGTIRDLDKYGGPAPAQSDNNLEEVTLELLKAPAIMSSFYSVKPIRYFTFKDTDVGTSTAGTYQYRVEMLFKDGTFEYLNGLLKEMTDARAALQAYYQFSLGSYQKEQRDIPAPTALIKDHEYKKTIYAPYFQNGSFSAKFLEDVPSKFSPDNTEMDPWATGGPGNPTVRWTLFKIGNIFNIESNITSDTLGPLLSPTSGSPRGIEFVIKFADAIIDHLYKLIGATKINKTGSEISQNTIPNGYNLSSLGNFIASPSEALIKEHHSFDHPSELHKALSNEDIYIDYLSVGPSAESGLDSTSNGPLRISKNNYMTRCQLDANKLSPYAATERGFNGIADADSQFFAGGNIHPQGPTDNKTDSLAATGYSYLMPSIIELSDPSEENEVFNYKINAFSAAGAVNDETFDVYDRVLVGLTNYGFDKIDVDDADLMPNYYKPTEPTLAGLLGSYLYIRGSYKNLFSMAGITIHDESKYNEFFNKKPGAQAPPVASPEIDELLPVWPDDFSDGTLKTDSYYKNLFFDEKNVFNTPTGIHQHDGPYQTSLPNIFKLASFWPVWEASATAATWEPPLSDLFKQAAGKAEPQYNSYFFINTNLMSEVQVYVGPAEANSGATFSNMKNDDESWKMLDKNLLISIEAQGALQSTRVLFCRTVLYDEKAAQGLTLPIIGKYFLIHK